MKKREKISFFNSIFFVMVFVFCIFIFHANNAEADEIMRIGYRTLAPHSMPDNQKSEPAGAAVEYLEKYIAPKMKVKIEWSLLPFSRLIKYIDEGEIDAVLLLGKNPERESKYLFPTEPLVSVKSGLALNKTSPLTLINTADDLKGMKIGFTKDGYISPFMKNEQISFEYVVGTENIWQKLLKMLNMKRFDAVYNPTLLTLKYDAKLIGLEENLKFIELPEPSVDLYVVFSKKAAALYKRYDEVHTAIRDTIRYQDILKKYAE